MSIVNLSRLFMGGVTFLLVLSVASTYYQSVIKQDIDPNGILVEKLDDGQLHVAFLYDGVIYNLVSSSNYDQLVLDVSREIGFNIVGSEFELGLGDAYADSVASHE